MNREDAIREIDRLGEHVDKMQASINAFNNIKKNSYYHTKKMVDSLDSWVISAYFEQQEALTVRYRIEKKHNLHGINRYIT